MRSEGTVRLFAADAIFTTLMGADVVPRKKFIQTHAEGVKNLDI